MCFKIGSSTCQQLDEEIQSMMTKIEEQNDPGKAGICMQCLWKRGHDFKHKDSHQSKSHLDKHLPPLRYLWKGLQIPQNEIT